MHFAPSNTPYAECINLSRKMRTPLDPDQLCTTSIFFINKNYDINIPDKKVDTLKVLIIFHSTEINMCLFCVI